MKKKLIALFCIGLLVSGCGKNPTTKDGKEVLISFKDGTQITVDEVYTELKEQYGLNTILPMIYKTVLESEFKDSIDETKEKAKDTVTAYAEMYGGEDKLLEMLNNYYGIKDIETFTDNIYISGLQDKAALEYAKTQVSDKEIKAYYKDSVYGDVNIKHILITPEVTSELSEDEIAKAEDKAKETVNKIIDELKETKDAKAKFEELAKKYSQDDDTKENGGNLGYINYGTLSESYDELVDAALNLKDGEFSTKVITTELGYHVIYRIDQKEKASLEDSKAAIIEKLATKAVSESDTLAGEAMQFYCNKHGLEINDSYLKTQYAKYVQSTLSQKVEEDSESKEK